MISISIDPENDTPQQLKAYAGKFDAGPRWQFLTGSVENVATVQRAFDTYNSDKMSHEPLTLLRSAPGKPWVRIDGFASPEDLAREYQQGRAKVGTSYGVAKHVADRVLRSGGPGFVLPGAACAQRPDRGE